MKILLVQAFTLPYEPHIFPLGLSYVATMLKEHDVRIFDLNISPKPYDELVDIIKEFSPDVIGYSMRNIKLSVPGKIVSGFGTHQEAARIIRSIAPATPILAGGAAFSLYAEETMNSIPELDIGVFGEGEEVINELLANLETPEKVMSVFYRKDGKVVFTGYRDRPDFGKLPAPRRDLVDISKYGGDTSVGVETTRGCAFRCIHCSDLFLLGGMVRMRDAKSVVDEIEDLVNNYGIKSFMFADQIFNLPAEHAKDICREIVARGIKVNWTAWFTPLGLDTETVRLSKQAGCTMLSFTPDHVDNDVLMRIRKGIRYEDIKRCNDIALAEQMPVGYSFLINLPGESVSSIMNLVWFVIKTKLRLGKLFKLHGMFIVPVRIYPHTDLKTLSVQEGIVAPDDALIDVRIYSPRSVAGHLGTFVADMVSYLWHIKNFKKLIKKSHA